MHFILYPHGAQASSRKFEERNCHVVIIPASRMKNMSTSKSKVVRRSSERDAEPFSPQTQRGRRLLALRQKIIAAGIPLLSPEEIEHEIRERRGEDE